MPNIWDRPGPTNGAGFTFHKLKGFALKRDVMYWRPLYTQHNAQSHMFVYDNRYIAKC